jgi:hypothetical protein
MRVSRAGQVPALLACALILAPIAKSQKAAPVLTTLYSFGGTSDGADPETPLVFGRGGVLYGTTRQQGSALYGTAFSLSPPASPGGSWTETTIHTFGEVSGDGLTPFSGLTAGKGGVLYRVTIQGGPPGDSGTVYSLIPPATAGGAWTENVQYGFPYILFGPKGFNPVGSLAIGPDGTLYGENSAGGANGIRNRLFTKSAGRPRRVMD